MRTTNDREPKLDIMAQIKRQMRAQGRTQKSIATETGHTESNVSLWLHGDKEPSLRTAEEMASALGCRLVLVRMEA